MERKSKAGWREIGGKRCYFRSKWEANYARYLEFLKHQKQILDWEHEPKTFWFDDIRRGVCSYLPDFKVIENDHKQNWIEVKGYMDARSLTKIKRFRKYYPDEILRIIDGKWFKANNKKLKWLPGWE